MSTNYADATHPSSRDRPFLVELSAIDGMASRWCMEMEPDGDSALAAAVARSPGFRVVRITDADGAVRDFDAAPGGKSE